MAHSWSIAGGVVTLTLDGSGSGPVSRSRTFTAADGITADALHTFYLVVDPSVVAIGAFLEIEGGDTTVAEAVGPNLLRARGTADSGANITVRYGAQSIEAVPASEGSDDLDYPDNATAEAADWVRTGAAAFGVVHPINGISPVAALTGEGSIAKTFSLSPGGTYTFRLGVESSQAQWFVDCHIFATTGGATTEGYGAQGGVAGVQEASITVTADGTGEITLTVSQTAFFGFVNTFWIAGLTIEGVTGGGATIDFSDLRYCLGSGISETGGTGLGQGATENDPGNDPIPEPPVGGYPPPPTGGARPYIAYNLPPQGFGYYNGTVIPAAPSWIVNAINAAATAGAKLFMSGVWTNWLDPSGKFSLALWKADIQALATHPIAGPAILAAIAAGVIVDHYLIDEPYHPSRYGRIVTPTECEQMGAFSKGFWPTLKTSIRVAPLEPGVTYITRKLANVDRLWALYWLRNGGDPASYRDRNIARAAELGYELIIGMNTADPTAINSPPMTPDQYRHYAGILGSTDSPVVKAWAEWRWEAGMYGQSGFPEAVRYGRDNFASYDS